MMDRLTEISNSFADNRDILYRKQLQTYQADMNFINSANLYENKPLDEPGEDSAEEVNDHVAHARPAQPNDRRLEAPLTTGRHTARFVQEINDAMEERDASLTTVAHNHNFRINQLQNDHLYQVTVAHEEHQRLVESVRQRLITTVKQKVQLLHREKEKLDIAEINGLLHHPNQFNINNSASPGGPQSNRKTRHTRHRLEVEDLEVVGGKRKRKAPAENDNGSPGPAGRDVEPTNGFKEANAKLEAHQVIAPLYSIDRLFSDRDLNANLQQASYDVIQKLGAKRRKLDSENNPASTAPTNADVTDLEDDVAAETAFGGEDAVDELLLAAPEMGRTITNTSFHATRSARTQIPKNGRTARESLGDLAGREAAVALIGTYPRDKYNPKNDEYQRAPALSDQEGDEDMALMQRAIQDENNGETVNTKLMDELLEEQEDHVGTGAVEGNGIIGIDEPATAVEES